MSFSWLPQVLAEIAEVAGIEAAMKIAEKRGGERVYIPAAAPDDHWLVQTVGRKEADAICRHFSFVGAEGLGRHGERIEIPQGPAGGLAKVRKTVDRMIAENRPTSEIVRAAGYTSRGVEKRRQRSRQRQDVRQGRLF